MFSIPYFCTSLNFILYNRDSEPTGLLSKGDRHLNGGLHFGEGLLSRLYSIIDARAPAALARQVLSTVAKNLNSTENFVKSHNGFAWISAQPLLEPILNMHYHLLNTYYSVI